VVANVKFYKGLFCFLKMRKYELPDKITFNGKSYFESDGDGFDEGVLSDVGVPDSVICEFRYCYECGSEINRQKIDHICNEAEEGRLAAQDIWRLCGSLGVMKRVERDFYRVAKENGIRGFLS